MENAKILDTINNNRDIILELGEMMYDGAVRDNRSFTMRYGVIADVDGKVSVFRWTQSKTTKDLNEGRARIVIEFTSRGESTWYGPIYKEDLTAAELVDFKDWLIDKGEIEEGEGIPAVIAYSDVLNFDSSIIDRLEKAHAATRVEKYAATEAERELNATVELLKRKIERDNAISNERITQYVNVIREGYKNGIELVLYCCKYVYDGDTVRKLFISDTKIEDNIYPNEYKVKRILDGNTIINLTSAEHIRSTCCSCGSDSYDLLELILSGKEPERPCVCKFDYEKMGIELLRKHIKEQIN